MILIGQFKPRLIETFDRTQEHFVQEDYARMNELLASPPRSIVTTPHILTEASNLGGQLTGVYRANFFRTFASLRSRIDERNVPASDVLSMPELHWLGFTDAAILFLAHSGVLTITIDAPLHDYLQRSGLASLNYAHISHAIVSDAEWQPKRRKKGSR